VNRDIIVTPPTITCPLSKTFRNSVTWLKIYKTLSSTIIEHAIWFANGLGESHIWTFSATIYSVSERPISTQSCMHLAALQDYHMSHHMVGLCCLCPKNSDFVEIVIHMAIDGYKIKARKDADQRRLVVGNILDDVACSEEEKLEL
jgi:hypothetical protein